MSLIDPDQLTYEGCDLEAMSQAPNYYKWLVSVIKPYLGDTVVEVGAGSGSFSKQLLTAEPKKAIFVEPTKNMYRLLKQNIIKDKQGDTQVKSYNAYLSDITEKLKADKPDTFIYINVFEHIEDDLEELKIIKGLLPKGGHAIIFVPAHQVLLSEFDKSIGHYRRYNKKMVTNLAQKSGLEIMQTRYMDMVGPFPWLVNFKLLKRKRLDSSMIGVYDRFAIPVIRTVETCVQPPFGKNVLLIARKK